MKLLYLVANDGCQHDYGADYLCRAFYSLLGAENVFDWPEKPSLHIPGGQLRDACNLACDAWLPRKNLPLVLDERIDLAIIACQPDDLKTLADIRLVCRALPYSTPIACVDTTDHVRDLSGYYTEVAGRPLVAYFKRELPIGADWGIACPLSFPASLAPSQFAPKHPLFFYHATTHGNQGPGRPRQIAMNHARHLLPDSQMDIGLYPTQQNRPSPEEYWQRMARALVTFSWNGWPYCKNWDCNRFWESMAHGLAVIAERPRIQIPNPPVDGEHCVYIDHIDELPVKLEMLTANDWAEARRIGANAREHFLRYHSSEARARYVLREIERRA